MHRTPRHACFRYSLAHRHVSEPAAVSARQRGGQITSGRYGRPPGRGRLARLTLRRFGEREPGTTVITESDVEPGRLHGRNTV